MNIGKMLLAVAILFAAAPAGSSAECTVCHSKDPKMVRMHSALEFKDCFNCHGPSAQPMERSKRSGDTRCLPCHKD